MMKATVWMAGWQMQCCGDPFAVGDEVEWSLAEPDAEWLGTTLGATTAAEITHEEDHHNADERPMIRARGIVHRIRQVYVVHARSGRDERTRYPVPGSGEEIDVTDSRDVETLSSQGDFSGYLVDLDLF